MVDITGEYSDVRARIGMVNFINTAPCYEVWKKTVHRPEWQVIEATPSELNMYLYGNRLDLGLISSHEYAIHPSSYRILGDLSISASGSVGSVFLFSHEPPEDLSNRYVQLSPQSQTSNSLIQIILEEFYKVTPRYQFHDFKTSRSILKQGAEISAVLAIGDEALRMAKKNEYPFRMDLSEIWQRHTGLPFVFAVWAVREDFCSEDPDSVVAIHRELQRCTREGREKLQEMSELVCSRIPMSPKECYDYLKGIEYDLGEEKKKALNVFYDFLIKRGEASAITLPIRYCE